MRPKIYCISLGGAPVPPQISEILAIESVKLYRDGGKKWKFYGSIYGGRITTERQSVGFFGISGIGFKAEMEYEMKGETRKVRVNYVITPAILGMDFSEGYDFVNQDFAYRLQSFIKEFEEYQSNRTERKEADPIGETVGSC